MIHVVARQKPLRPSALLFLSVLLALMFFAAAPAPPRRGKISPSGATLHWTSSVKLHIFLDRSSVEVFANDGETVLTDRIYPSPGSDGLEIFSDSGDSRIPSLTIWKLGSIWK